MNNGSCIPEYLIIEDVEIPIVLERSKRKTLAIGITQEGALKVKAPFFADETFLIPLLFARSRNTTNDRLSYFSLIYYSFYPKTFTLISISLLQASF